MVTSLQPMQAWRRSQGTIIHGAEALTEMERSGIEVELLIAEGKRERW